MNHRLLSSVFCALLTLCQMVWAEDALPAFPGAEGFGAFTKGGRGGKVYVVTTLEDYGKGEKAIPGSLREAVEAEGPRVVVFRVGGTVDLKQGLVVRNPFLTLAGQTAPGGGICLKRFPLVVVANDVVVRYLRCRVGDLARKEMDAVTVSRNKNVILDHLSASWSIDETLSVTLAEDVTVQWCVITEALHQSYHSKGRHGYGSLIGGGNISWHHNLYANHSSRNPRPGDVYLDFRNNVIYNWGGRSGYNGDDETKMNYVANYLKPGPSTAEAVRGIAFLAGGLKSRIYFADNRIEGAPQKDNDNRLMLLLPKEMPQDAAKTILVDKPFPVARAIKTDSAAVAFQKVLQDAGATLPKRDAVDLRIIQQIKDGTGNLIDSQDEVGGWPALEPGAPPKDSDMDGMPDDWEKQRGLNPTSPADASTDRDGDGYTNIEEYINGLSGK